MNTRLRELQPLIYCMTNDVVTNFTANGLLAIGASPVMSKNAHESGQLAAAANGLLLNTGTLTDAQLEAMIIAGKSANKHGVPIVLDPVAVGATTYRTESVERLLKEVDMTVVRGNAGEIASLLGAHSEIKGVEGMSNLDPATLAEQTAYKLQTIVCVTGETDAVSDGATTTVLTQGHAWLTKVVGTGCLLGAVIASYVSVKKDDATVLTTEAVRDYTIAAERAYETSQYAGIGTFQAHFLDELSKQTYS
ncbi:hydroxyethylthiazole kinase [Geomicrobium sp. JCM 19039]|uniref:hydroxyethylthiazole kinase n=1 Tax=Geomicrobium sp. JCM 19039 TaxID=1460636 RepID=UPI0027D91A15|nr:hydroxyethylthiazole kinase [Geomicrobium sp. JCM 19039]